MGQVRRTALDQFCKARDGIGLQQIPVGQSHLDLLLEQQGQRYGLQGIAAKLEKPVVNANFGQAQ